MITRWRNGSNGSAVLLVASPSEMIDVLVVVVSGCKDIRISKKDE